MRDIADCYTLAVFDSAHHLDPASYEKAQKGEFDERNLYKLDWNEISPIAIRQNLTCRIEQMMGIFPNIERLVVK